MQNIGLAGGVAQGLWGMYGAPAIAQSTATPGTYGAPNSVVPTQVNPAAYNIAVATIKKYYDAIAIPCPSDEGE